MRVKNLTILIGCVLFVYCVLGKPIKKEKEPESDAKDNEESEYLRYLGQVVEILEEDEEFKKKLHNATEDDIRSGVIADRMDLVSHNVRTKLDELKRMEIEYQRRIRKQERDHLNGINERNFWNPVFDENSETFETEDLKKLLHKHNTMMEEQDKKRRKDFHQYELEKEHKRREDMKKLNDEERKKKEHEHEEELKKLRKHEKMHQPGSKAELEEVWKEEDGLDPESFDPKTFFNLHDKDGNGFLDNYELETFFLDDVDKVYNESDPNTDPRERHEELERMREHVMKQMDKDEDGLISREEFIKSTHDPEFEKDDEWKPVVDDDEYSEDELKDYEKQLADEAAKNAEHNGSENEQENEEDHDEDKSNTQEHHEDAKERHEEKEQKHEDQKQEHQQQHQDQQQQHQEQQQQQQHQEQQQQQQHQEQQQQQQHQEQQQQHQGIPQPQH